jgi:hypothetical protein
MPLSPDCLGAPYKCPACSGDAWDDERDEMTACSCRCHEGRRQWVCDGCMRLVGRSQIADLADGEHVLCDRCTQQGARP